jgi:hypothetical protein
MDVPPPPNVPSPAPLKFAKSTVKPFDSPCLDGLSTLNCQVCISNYLSGTYGSLGGFVADTFNVQQAVPLFSGASTSDTLRLDVEVGALKQGIPFALRAGGNALALNGSGTASFWTGGIIDGAGVLGAGGISLFGAVTLPFASTALSIARSACGG